MSEKARRILNMIMAVLIAIAGWVFVVYNFDPMTNVTYKEVPIRFIGEDELAQRGYGVTDSSYESINVVLTQRRVKTGLISGADISVIADVSSSVEGQNGISLQISGPEGTQIAQAETRTITVDVEPVDTIEAEVKVIYPEGTVEGLEPIVSNITHTSATVVGANSDISAVDKLVAYVDPGEMTSGTRSFKRTLAAVDADGNTIPHMVIYPDEISFDATAGYTKTVALKLNTVDNSDDSYSRICTAPETIVIKGSQNAIENVEYIETEEISVTRLYEDTELDLSYILPDGIYIADESLGSKLKVTVTERLTATDDSEDDADAEADGEDGSDTADVTEAG